MNDVPFAAPAFAIGPYRIHGRALLAPMAGVTDRPFRKLCKLFGAAHVVSEMATSNPALWASDKTTRRLNHDGEPAPIAVQIAGSDPAFMAEAAAYNVSKGAHIIDINMGCPAKKVCKTAAGSALLRDEARVKAILEAVISVCRPLGVPVTLKYRTGWCPASKNAVSIGRLAEDLGVAALVLHGRTRACAFVGTVEYDSIAAVKAALSIPVIANGDICTPEDARQVLAYTKADAVMIGRAAQGRPWLFREIDQYLRDGSKLPPPSIDEIRPVILGHLRDHHGFYGNVVGVRTARKHLQWYLEPMLGPDDDMLVRLMQIDDPQQQLDAVEHWLAQHKTQAIDERLTAPRK